MNQRRWTEIEDGPRLMDWRDQGPKRSGPGAGDANHLARDYKMPRTELTRVTETLT